MKISLKDLENFIFENFEVHKFHDFCQDKNIVISGFSPIDRTKRQTVSWTNDESLESAKIKSELVIAPKEFILNGKVNFDVIQVTKPRLAFAKISSTLFEKKLKNEIHDSVLISDETSISKNVHIGPYSSISSKVSIGKNTIIENNVHIHENVSIGSNCYIQSNTVIGGDGFGFERDKDKSLIKIPHFGKVVIGDNVELGSMNTICRGTLGNTVIMNGVKIDNHVYVAHNCLIESNVIIAPGVIICGSVTVGENSWLGAQCSIIEGTNIAKETFIGIGAVLINDTEPNSTYVGNPARRLKDKIY